MMDEQKREQVAKAVDAIMRKCGVTIPKDIKNFTVEIENDNAVEKS